MDPTKSSQRDMLIALHVKMDQVVIPKLVQLEKRMKSQEDGDLTRGQEAAVRDMLQTEKDQRISRRSLRTPVWGLLISLLALGTSIVYTVTAVIGGHP